MTHFQKTMTNHIYPFGYRRENKLRIVYCAATPNIKYAYLYTSTEIVDIDDSFAYLTTTVL